MATQIDPRNSGTLIDPADLRVGPVRIEHLQAVCFDLDGTLYAQQPLRMRMAIKLCGAAVLNPWRGLRTLRILREYRIAQELLREMPAGSQGIGERQIEICCERSGYPEDAVRECVAEWFESAPLPFLKGLVRGGVHAFLSSARRRGIQLAVLSDYPAEAKLRAMGLRDAFDVVACAQDPEVRAFKPDPAGLQWIMRKLNVNASGLLYVGDRVAVDAGAARLAGVRAAILGTRQPAPGEDWFPVAGFAELERACGF